MQTSINISAKDNDRANNIETHPNRIDVYQWEIVEPLFIPRLNVK